MMVNIEFKFFKDTNGIVTLLTYKLPNGENICIDNEYQSLSHHRFTSSLPCVLSRLKLMSAQILALSVDLIEDFAKPYVEKIFTTLRSTGGFSIRNAQQNGSSSNSTIQLTQVMEPQINSQQLALEDSDDRPNKRAKLLPSNYDNPLFVWKQEIVSEVVNNLKGSSSSPEWPKLKKKLNGKSNSQNAESWLYNYEKLCFDNKCTSDTEKISGLRANLKDDALKWFGTMVRNCDDDWYFWRSLFLAKFCKNRISAAISADQWEYRSVNKLMDYYYQKERFIKIAYPNIDENSFVTKVMVGLPEIIQKQLLASNPQKKQQLIQKLQELDKQSVPIENNELSKGTKNFRLTRQTS